VPSVCCDVITLLLLPLWTGAARSIGTLQQPARWQQLSALIDLSVRVWASFTSPASVGDAAELLAVNLL
jgi:hypothetical protein